MTPNEHTLSINLENLETISRGDASRKLKYLVQFKELIPQRLDQLKHALNKKDRISVRQILHKMSPQLQFFGIKDIIVPIQRLEYEYETMPHNELNNLVNDIICKLEVAVDEVVRITNS